MTSDIWSITIYAHHVIPETYVDSYFKVERLDKVIVKRHFLYIITTLP